MGKLTRRIFLGLGAAAVGGLAIGGWYVTRTRANPLEGDLAAGDATFNPYVLVKSDGEIVVIAPRAEMGQGISTTLAALVAEELEVDLDQVTVAHGPASAAYANTAMLAADAAPAWDVSSWGESMRGLAETFGHVLGLQVTGGSSSTIDGYDKMRMAGAAARTQLIRAAADRWGVPADALRAERGEVVDPQGGRRATYGDLALAAAALGDPGDVALKDPAAWTRLGRSQPRVDLRDKVTGGRVFGIDVELPEMMHATVRMSPRFGAKAVSHDRDAALAVPGVWKIVPLDTAFGAGFGVIANSTWAAFKGAEALAPEWEAAAYPADADAQFAALARALDGEEGHEAGERGDAPAALAAAPQDEVFEVEYRAPFLAHGCLEPMNATARLREGKLDIWCGHQGPNLIPLIVADAAGVDQDAVEVHALSMGGGFGRRGEGDAPLYAALLARETDGRPVKVTWTREEDTAHDMYRPAALGRFRAHARPGEGPVALEMRIAAPPIIASVMGRNFPSMGASGADRPLLEGSANQPYGYENARFEGVEVPLGVPVGFWRAVGNSYNGFFHESFMDEIAAKAGVDPVAMRLRLMQGEDFATARRVVERVAEMSGWGAAEEGRAKGVAFTLSFGSWVGQVVEVSRRDGGVRVEKVWCAADLGRVLDPSIVEAQMISGINYGLSAAMREAVTFADGEVQELNFWDYDPLRMAQAPQIEVALMETAPRMGGAGEPGQPPAAPALANAIHALTGERLREMPFGRYVEFV
ncbi:MAG: molybdopterin cofactor-binding domain-containing protein [Pseudomonadota bacterium]